MRKDQKEGRGRGRNDLDEQYGAHGIQDDEVEALSVVRIRVIFLDRSFVLDGPHREDEVGTQG